MFFRIYGLAINGGIKFLQTRQLEKIYHYLLRGKNEAEEDPSPSLTFLPCSLLVADHEDAFAHKSSESLKGQL